ncbi:MAG TPA: chromosome segregation protein [Coprothermobacter sp.]|nr:chromosome segregation protein [Coprothermobacter sp.]
MEESVKRLADECFALGAQLEELSDDLAALNSDIRRTRMRVEEFFTQSQQQPGTRAEAETLETRKRELLEELQNLSRQWEKLNRALITLQELVFAKHEAVEYELDHLNEESEEYELLEDTLDDLSLVYAELAEILDEMDTLLLAIAELTRTVEQIKPSSSSSDASSSR